MVAPPWRCQINTIMTTAIQTCIQRLCILSGHNFVGHRGQPAGMHHVVECGQFQYEDYERVWKIMRNAAATLSVWLRQWTPLGIQLPFVFRILYFWRSREYMACPDLAFAVNLVGRWPGLPKQILRRSPSSK